MLGLRMASLPVALHPASPSPFDTLLPWPLQPQLVLQ
jgi:hypothetical protein